MSGSSFKYNVIIVLLSFLAPIFSESRIAVAVVSVKVPFKFIQSQAVQNTGQTREELEDLAEDLKVWLHDAEAHNKDTAIARTAFELGRVYVVLAEYLKAAECFEKTLGASRRKGIKGLEGAALAFMSRVYYELGAYQKAVQYAQESLPLVSDSSLAGLSFIMLGRIYRTWGKYDESLEYFEKSLEVRKRFQDLKGEAFTLNNMAVVHEARGLYQKAVEYLESALEISERINDPEVVGLSLTMLARIHVGLGQHHKSLEFYKKALAVTQKTGDRKTESTALHSMGKLYAQIGDFGHAFSSYEEALRILEKIGSPTDIPNSYIGNLYLDFGEIGLAEPYLIKTGSPQALGRLHLMKGEHAASRSYYSRVLADAEKSENVDDLFTACTGLGKICEALGDNSGAEKYYERAVDLVEHIRSGLLPSERKNFLSVKINGFYRSDPAKGLTRVRIKLNRPSQAIESIELTRTRAFADNIFQGSEFGYSRVPDTIVKQEEELVIKLASLKKELSKAVTEKTPERRQNLIEEISATEKELQNFVNHLWENYQAYAAVKFPRPVALKDSAVKSEEFLVIFDVSQQGIAALLVKGKEILRTTYIEQPSAMIENQLQQFRKSFETVQLRGFDPELGKMLYKNLLAPLIIDVPHGSHLTIIPDGVLQLLPFEALVVSGEVTWQKSSWGEKPEGLTYLGDVYSISYHQSITALSLGRTIGNLSKSGGRLLVIADPVFEEDDERFKALPSANTTAKNKAFFVELMNSIGENSGGGFKFKRLKETGTLAENLELLFGQQAERVSGLKANKQDFIAHLVPIMDHFGWIVFATHGLFSNRTPGLAEPFLALSTVPSGTDGLLRMSEVMGFRMKADLVALTACQTGMGKDLIGEGVMSMGRAFQYAGAKSVLMSLWSVSEKSSVVLVESFFKHIKAGKTKLKALRLAREEIRKNGFDHPFFWAPFVLMGDID